jgi:hypothetical protein
MNYLMYASGMNRAAFAELVTVLFGTQDSATVGEKRGRPKMLENEDKLGMYLIWLNSTLRTKHLCMLFGVVPSSVTSCITEMRKLICNILITNPASEIKFPDEDRKQYYASLCQRREPSVDNVIGFVDGVSLQTQCSSDPAIQSSFYNGYHHDTMVNNVFAFSPEGKIIMACINYPGSWHDSQVAAKLISKVIRAIGNYCLCVDQGFPRSGDCFGKFVGPVSKRQFKNIAPELRHIVMEKSNIYVSLRQASEWGMRALQATFGRLKTRLPSDEEKRREIILSVVLLHNFRTHHVGLNQIATVFNPLYEKYYHLQNYDRISSYYLQLND